mmetsp:Transcript_58896/g.119944  ORF Transcript_58896/g.119944 Transcript_58896/m.119944 type:complete len:263 (+) Transcript_58896:1857-2645(+)
MCVLVVSGSTNKRTQTTPPQASIHALFSLLVFHSMDESIRLNSVEFGSIRLVAQQTCLASIEKRNHNKNRDGRDRKIPSVSVGRSSSLFPDQISAMVKPSIIATSNPRLVDKSGLVWFGLDVCGGLCLRLFWGVVPDQRNGGSWILFVPGRFLLEQTHGARDGPTSKRENKKTRNSQTKKAPKKNNSWEPTFSQSSAWISASSCVISPWLTCLFRLRSSSSCSVKKLTKIVEACVMDNRMVLMIRLFALRWSTNPFRYWQSG